MTDSNSNGPRRPRQSDAVRPMRSNGALLLFDHDGMPLGELNESAAALWELCDGQTTADEMVDAVCMACPIVRDDAEIDVARALDELSRAGLIVWSR